MLVLTISTLVTRTRDEAVEIIETTGADKDGKKSEVDFSENLAQVPYIRYPITFRKKSVPVLALFDLGSKVNTIYLTFAQELGLPIKLTDVRAQKNNGTMLDTYGMVVAAFSVMDKANQVKFLKETFLVANVSLEVFFGIPFFTLSGADIDFLDHELR